jgi:hypothetical protein
MQNDKINTTQAELELSVIKKIMEDSRSVVLNNGWHYIFWGVVVSAALIANYIMALTGIAFNYQGLMWLIAMVSAAIIGGIYEKYAEKKRKVKTFAANLLGSLWFAGGIAMFMFGFIGSITKAYNAIYIPPIIGVVLGVTFYTSGAIQQLKMLKNIAYIWWTGAILLFIFPTVHTLLIFGLMMIFLQVIPGIIIHRKFKKESV